MDPRLHLKGAMDILSGMFRPSVASAGVFSFSRIVSFAGSFNSRTSLLAGEDSLPQAQEMMPSLLTTAASTVTDGAFDDVEAARDGGAVGLQGNQDEGQAAAEDEPKRVSKSVHTVCLFVASASLVMSFNLPRRPAVAEKLLAALYGANLAFICLGMFTSLGLSMYSIVARPGDAALAKVQKRAMLLAVASVLASFTLRMFAMVPGRTLVPALLTFFLFAGAAALYLTVTWMLGVDGPTTADYRQPRRSGRQPSLSL
ncbi:hypothetical protein GUJ93_ZPchr0008g12316 [Zizania palustris]|uniref:Uncharacterized protein n=1 Tax=Zizania palustris TaxID=103762 RepID=A0A8J5RH15_ZIZPA|nr:hypothetical protein GUJ93_ZPchr0008g12316 [Zizania palustris]